MLGKTEATSIAEVSGEKWQVWFEKLEDFGLGNYVITDGISVLAYRSQNSEEDVYIGSFKPPYEDTVWRSAHLELLLDEIDHHRTMLTITTEKTCPGDFQAFEKANSS